MKILFLTSAHNSLSQRLLIELTERGHEIRVCVAATGEAMLAAVSREVPDLIIAPMLKIAIPEEVWSRYLCLIVHPGIEGDRGPSRSTGPSPTDEKTWGVTILEAAPDFDAGPIWASHEFALEADPPSKSSLYRGQVTEAALRGVLEAVAEYSNPVGFRASRPMSHPYMRGCLRPPMRQADRAIDWMRDETATILTKSARRTALPASSARCSGKVASSMGRMKRSASKVHPARFWPGVTARSASARSMALSGSPI